MSRQRAMQRFAQWHIWLGWLVGLPILMWTVTGLIMVAKPIEEVRGNHLRKANAETLLPAGNPRPISFPVENPASYTEMRVAMQGDRAVWFLTREDGGIERYPADDEAAPLPEIDEAYVRALVAEKISGGGRIARIARFEAAQVPFDFRRPMPVWQAALDDGTHVYVGAETGEIEAVRTRWWRLFDFVWGLHIMDLETREDTHHPILVLFAAMSVIGALLGCILMFRRRKARPSAPAKVAAP
ncbi:PepSY domain-containing protein [Qipengyuania sp. XHP0207]|uniref:PepSY domain-containing protein n=1 Tax=Qipengyuania sp. XHP0207 TaxID=3038078 RepID=UPI00241DE301|nr:PepSY domain-containing protein [Qipengyuania sp. XHP0207]MDG5747204.1 PepSY domain-containing protein [Qipengyuania sp. XHP0207]